MNKNISKLLCLCLAFMLTLSTVAYAQVVEEFADYEAEIEVQLLEENEVYLNSEPLKAVYLEYKIGGPTMADDTAIGDIKYATDIPDILYPITPTAGNRNMKWAGDGQIADWGAKRVEIGGYWATMTAPYYRKDRPTSAYAIGNMPFALGNSFTKDYNQAVFEVEFYDNTTNPFSIIYMNSESATSTSGVNISRTGTDTWCTASVLTGADAHLYRNSKTGLGVGNTSPLRINSNGEIYVKAFRVYTPGYRELLAASEEITIDADLENAESDFALPVSSAADSVVWSSSDEDVVSIADGMAVINRADYESGNSTLTAKVVKDGYYIEKTFDVTVKARYEDLMNVKDSLVLEGVDTDNVKGDFTLPEVDEKYTVEWTSSDDKLVSINGNNAIVNSDPFVDEECTLTAKIYFDDNCIEKVFELKFPMQYKKVKYAEYIIGETLADDISSGKLKYDTVLNDIDLSRVEPSDQTSNLPLVTSNTHDWASMREMHGDRWAAVTGRYSRPNRTDSPIADGNMPYDTGDTFAEDTSLVIEVEYFDNVKGSFNINYKNSASTSRKVSIPKNGDGIWKTHSIELDDVYFVPGKTGMGSGNQSDFRFEAAGSDVIIGAVRVYLKGYEKIADAVERLEFENELTGITEPFALPELDGVEIFWSSSDKYAVWFEDGMAMINGSDEEETNCTITAKIAANGVYTEKEFDVNLAKKPKKAVITGTPDIIKEGSKNTVTFNLTNAGNLAGKYVNLILNAVDNSTGGIVDKTVKKVKVTGDDVLISASVEVEPGQQLKYFLTDEKGASLYNTKPLAIENFKGSSKTNGAGFSWDYAKDDYFISEYVIYDKLGNEIMRTQENSFVVEGISVGEIFECSVEGFDHEGYPTGRTSYDKASLFVPSYSDLSNPMTDASNKNDVYFCTLSKVIEGGDSFTIEETKTDALTGESRVGRRTVNRSAIGKWNTNLYFRADRTNVDDSVREVTIIVDYYDEGNANVNINYNAADGSAGKSKVAFQTTGTNTWKTAVIHLTDAKFTAPSSLTNCDFRLNGGHNGEICVSKVTILPTENY